MSSRNGRLAPSAIGPVLALLVLQALLVAWTFPLPAVLSAEPLMTIDAAYHWYQMGVAGDLAAGGRLTGYDPTFAAGHVGGVVLNASAKVPTLLAVLLQAHLSAAQVYKLYVFIAALLGPLCVPWACRVLRLESRAIFIAGFLGLLLWWVSAFRWYHTAGMVGFIFAAYMSLPFAAHYCRALTADRPILAMCGAGLLGAFGFFLHPLFPVLAVFPIFAWLLVSWREVKLARLVFAATIVGVVSALPNLPWLLTLVTAGTGEIGAQPYQQRVDILMLPRELLGQWRDGAMGSKLYAGLLAAALLGLCGHARSARRLVLAGLGAWLALGLFAWGGAVIPGAGALQPNRFAAPAYLLLVIPAGATLARTWDAWAGIGSMWRVPVAAFLCACALSIGYATWELTREVSYRPVGHYGAVPPEVRGVGPKSAWIIDVLQTQTTREGRIFFEVSLGRVHDNAHMAGYLARATGREFIGGPYPFMFKASFWDGFAFGRPLQSLSEVELRRDFDAFNIGWIVAHTAVSKDYFTRVPWITLLQARDGISIYRVDRELGYFFTGEGVVESAEVNRVVLSGLRGPRIALKYRFVPGLIVAPTGRVAPYRVPGIDEPFIEISGFSGGRAELSLQ